MAYCLDSDVLARAPAVAAAPQATAQVEAAIVAAQARIDGRLQSKFSVPFGDPVPAMVKTVAIDLAAARAIMSTFSGSEHSEIIAFAKNLQDNAMKDLDDIVSGALKLSDVTTTEVISSRVPQIHITSVPSSQIRCLDMLGHHGPKMPDNHWVRTNQQGW